MQQNPAAPIIAGGSVIGGMAGLIFGVFAIGDCVRFQVKKGECDQTVNESSVKIVLGFFAVAGAVGGYFTINPMLDRAKRKTEAELPTAEPIVIPPSPQSERARWGDEDETAERVQFMAARGLSAEQIAEATGADPAAVEQILAGAADLEPGL